MVCNSQKFDITSRMSNQLTSSYRRTIVHSEIRTFFTFFNYWLSWAVHSMIVWEMCWKLKICLIVQQKNKRRTGFRLGFIEIFAQLYKKYKICLKVVLIQNSNKKLTTELLSTTLLTPGGKWHNTINCCLWPSSTCTKLELATEKYIVRNENGNWKFLDSAMS